MTFAAVDTFAPFDGHYAPQSTDWIPCREARAAGLEFCQAVVAVRRALQPTGGLDGGALNRLAVQALTGNSPEDS